MSNQYFVTMTDKHMSGWGRADGKINKLVFECESYKEAEIVQENAENHGSMTYINIRMTRPRYSSSKYLAQTMTRENSSAWYTQGRFKK